VSEHPLHIVLGDNAAGTLREACRTLGLPGKVHPIADDLSHGPLHDGRARSVYFKAQIYGHDPDVAVPDDAFQDWSVLEEFVRSRAFDAITIWNSFAIGDAIFLRMACARLRGFDGLVYSVNTSEGSWHGVGTNGPEQLTAHYRHRVALGMDDRDGLASAFEAIVSRADLLRVFAGDQIVSANSNHFDAYIRSFAKPEWERAVRTIGNCMFNRENDKMMIGDAFFEWRLRTLIQAGQLEAQGDLSHLRGYQVRLAAAL
jgi:Protein of unknown function/Domain of unknown function (DUF1835)